MKIAAILVCFDPARSPRDAVDRLATIVDSTIIVDNRKGGHPALHALDRPQVTILRNDNIGGLAGAYNRALSWIAEYQREITHILFVDDDSDLAALDAFLRSEATREVAAHSSVAAVAPVYRDKRTGLRGRHIQLDRFRFRFLPREQTTPVDVAFVINSMSLWRVDVLTRLGPYSVALGVDHIDTEYAMRAKRAGFRIVLNAGVEFLHEIGERRSYKLFGKTVQSGGHGADRRFLIGRNTVIVAKKHGFAYPAFMLLCLQRLCYESLGILIAENSKAAKLSGLWRGALRGLVTRA